MKHGKSILTLLLGAAFVLFPGILAPGIYADEPARFRELSGTVEVRVPDTDVWAMAAAGDPIAPRSLISTGFRSSAVITLGSSIIIVRPVTRLSLEEIITDQGGERISLYLRTGRVRAEVEPPVGGRTEFTVRSPMATASVRGTSFEFDTERLWVEEGRVHYALANGRRVYVAGGGTSYVDEVRNIPVSPFDAAAELLSPALSAGSASGGPLGDRAPAIHALPRAAQDGALRLGFGWE